MEFLILMRPLLTSISFIFLCFFFPEAVFSEIIVHDMIALRGEVTMLSAETKGTILRHGGEIVEFIVNGKSLGKSLSGGDGYAFKQFIPPKTGLYQIIVKSRNEENSGSLLSLKKGARIVFIDIEHGLFEGLFSKRPRSGSQEVLRRLSKKSPVVFLQTGILSTNAVRTWLKNNGFPDLPLIQWDQGSLFDEINGKGLKIKAIIGGEQVIESAGKYKPKAFSFGEVEGAEKVNDWGEIGRKLK
jgi:hypothetical protein